MRDKGSFSTFDPLFSDAPALCDLCANRNHQFFNSRPGAKARTRSGPRGKASAARLAQPNWWRSYGL